MVWSARPGQASQRLGAGCRRLSEFHDYLAEARRSFTEAEWNDNRNWIQEQLKREMYATGFSYEDSQKVAIETGSDGG